LSFLSPFCFAPAAASPFSLPRPWLLSLLMK
jgi:hypothetical protein